MSYSRIYLMSFDIYRFYELQSSIVIKYMLKKGKVIINFFLQFSVKNMISATHFHHIPKQLQEVTINIK